MERRIFLVQESLNEKKEIGSLRDIDINDEININDEEEIVDDIVPNEDIEDDTDEVEIENIEDAEIFDKVDVSDMDDEDDVIVDEEPTDNEELVIYLRNELLIADIDREPIAFTVANDPKHQVIEAVPMAEMGNGEAFLFKLTSGGYKKIYVKDIIVQE